MLLLLYIAVIALSSALIHFGLLAAQKLITAAQLSEIAEAGDFLEATTIAAPNSAQNALTREWRIAARIVTPVCAVSALARITGAGHFDNLQLILLTAEISLITASIVLSGIIDGASHFVFKETLLAAPLFLLMVSLVANTHFITQMLLGSLLGAIVFYGLYIIGRLMYGFEALAFGDVELAIFFGALFGLESLKIFMIGAIIMAVVVGVFYLLKKLTAHSYAPMGVFLASGALLFMVFAPPQWM